MRNKTPIQALVRNNKLPITARSVIIGFILIPFNSYWILHLSYVWDSNRPTSLSLLFNVLFTLIVLIAVNELLYCLNPKLVFSQTELITIYVMLCQASVFAGRDMVQVLIPLMSNGFWYATSENEWSQLFHRHLPPWLVVEDRELLRGFYQGQSTLYLISHIFAWIKPVLIWLGFCLILGITMFCLNVLLRKQWQEYEKLTYPIIQLPYEITLSYGANTGYVNDSRRFFFSRLVWLGVVISGVLNLLYSLNQIDPSFPSIPLYRSFHLVERPWSAMNNPGFRISFFPFAIGVGFLIPLDLGFSCWFFHLFWHFERIVGDVFGWRSAIGFPREMAQIRGTWIGIFVFTMWMGRHHFKTVFSRILTSQTGVQEEALSYHTAIIGAVTGLFLIILFCYQAGMLVWIALLFFIIYFAMSITITRIRAELGPPAHDFYNAGPDLFLIETFGTRRINAQNLSVMSLFFWLNHLSYRAHPMPHQLEALKLSHQTRINQFHIFLVIILAIVIGAFSAMWGHLHISYEIGLEQARSWYARSAFTRLAGWLYNPSETQASGLIFTLGGFVVSIALLVLRLRFVQWPLHPVGYVVSSWWTFTGLWFPILISWTIKRLLLSYGGVRNYRRVVPFFLGLIVGDVVVASTISILGLIFNFSVRYLSW
ncbi:TPA: hypothetical protein EYN98_17420 [Candidatus Poribacteria bacterium]|nr:hypothetical protein [Candidatus Poribacteria bacterium]HIB91334.1 hypothetical protein [Candidatus Poribacteria bacterium]HIN29837.1 hypothetical protein [Candidatus Poribacteria bacterium]HIO07422.1 hypothetical protein [Candidatus Poribacteria bacterium]HIO47329.1 hypothetical protein [Candidatus Poribacteria bacterium]